MIAKLTRIGFGGLVALTLNLASLSDAYGGICGPIGNECCPMAPECDPGAVCNGTTCVACGGENEFCCPNGVCDEDDLACIPDLNESPGEQGGGAAVAPLTCKPCGGEGEPCCDSGCESGNTCFDCDLNESIGGQGGGAGTQTQVCPLGFPSICLPCGGLSQLCCDGECNEGFDCEFPTEVIVTGQGSGAQLPPEPICIPCGALGQECCDSQTCGSDNLFCAGGLCEACGDINEQCCPNDTCPNSGGVCIDDTCTPLPAVATLSRSGMIALILTLTAIGSLCMRPREV